MGVCFPRPTPVRERHTSETQSVETDPFGENLMWHRRVREIEAAVRHAESILLLDRHPQTSDLMTSHTIPPAPPELLERQMSASSLRLETEGLKTRVATLHTRNCLLNCALITLLYAPPDSPEYLDIIDCLEEGLFFENVK